MVLVVVIVVLVDFGVFILQLLFFLGNNILPLQDKFFSAAAHIRFAVFFL